MEKSGSACFIRHPRTIGDLMQPHLYKQEQEYQIVKTVELGKMDYENFITDMLADRQFIEDNAGLCSQGEVWQCLLIRQRECSDGGIGDAGERMLCRLGSILCRLKIALAHMIKL